MITWGKRALSPVPRGVGCVCDVRCRWALLTLLVSVLLAWAGGTLVLGLATPVGRSWAGIPGHWGAVFVCQSGRPVGVGLLGLLLGVFLLDGLALGWAWGSVLSGAVRLFHPVGPSLLAVGKCHTMLLLVHGHVGCSWVVVRVGWFWGVSSLVGDF